MAFDPVINLGDLDGSNGFRIDGVAAIDWSGRAPSGAGDINGDGFDDLIIGAGGADPNGMNFAGSSYIVFGTDAGFAATLDLASLNGSTGFRLDGVASGENSGFSVSAAGDLITTSQFGFGLAVAILIDATIVRSVLVPATMKLLGDKNWYLPSFLHWLPDLRVEGGAPAPNAAAVAGGDD